MHVCLIEFFNGHACSLRRPRTTPARHPTGLGALQLGPVFRYQSCPWRRTIGRSRRTLAMPCPCRLVYRAPLKAALGITLPLEGSPASVTRQVPKQKHRIASASARAITDLESGAPHYPRILLSSAGHPSYLLKPAHGFVSSILACPQNSSCVELSHQNRIFPRLYGSPFDIRPTACNNVSWGPPQHAREIQWCLHCFSPGWHRVRSKSELEGNGRL